MSFQDGGCGDWNSNAQLESVAGEPSQWGRSGGIEVRIMRVLCSPPGMVRLHHHASRRLLPRKNGSVGLGSDKRGMMPWRLYGVQDHVDINKIGSRMSISVPSHVYDLKLLTPYTLDLGASTEIGLITFEEDKSMSLSQVR